MFAAASQHAPTVINNQPAPLWRFHDFWRSDMSVQTYLLTYIYKHDFSVSCDALYTGSCEV